MWRIKIGADFTDIADFTGISDACGIMDLDNGLCFRRDSGVRGSSLRAVPQAGNAVTPPP
jgi:hypothetical protein